MQQLPICSRISSVPSKQPRIRASLAHNVASLARIGGAFILILKFIMAKRMRRVTLRQAANVAPATNCSLAAPNSRNTLLEAVRSAWFPSAAQGSHVDRREQKTTKKANMVSRHPRAGPILPHHLSAAKVTKPSFVQLRQSPS